MQPSKSRSGKAKHETRLLIIPVTGIPAHIIALPMR